MRRVLAAIYALASLAYWAMACLPPGLMSAFWAGLASACASIVLLFFTTWSDLSQTASAIRGTIPLPLAGASSPPPAIPLAEEPEK